MTESKDTGGSARAVYGTCVIQGPTPYVVQKVRWRQVPVADWLSYGAVEGVACVTYLHPHVGDGRGQQLQHQQPVPTARHT